MLKKGISIIVIVLMSITFLCACSKTHNNADKLVPSLVGAVNSSEGITMTIVDGTVSPTGMSVVLKNNSDREFVYVPLINLEVQMDDMWYEVPVLNDITYDMALSSLDLGAEKELALNWEHEYGKLGKGKYRAVLSEQSHTVPEGAEIRFLAAEFEIK